MEQLKSKTFQELIEMTRDIANKFFFAKKMHDMKIGDTLAEFSYDEDIPYDNYLIKVQSAYDCLSAAEQNLINNEFFFQSYHRWWETVYSKATFYRYKREAMINFLGAFYAQ